MGLAQPDRFTQIVSHWPAYSQAEGARQPSRQSRLEEAFLFHPGAAGRPLAAAPVRRMVRRINPARHTQTTGPPE
jgi:hypothetical protein